MEQLSEACWEGYEMQGLKERKGRMVPNCVPVDEGLTDILKALKAGERVTPEQLPPNFANMSPEERRTYQGSEAERLYPAMPLDMIARHVKGPAGAKARYALSEPMVEKYTLEEWMSMLEEAGYSLEEGNKKLTWLIPVAALPMYKKGQTPTVIDPNTGEESVESDVSSWAADDSEVNEYCPRCLMEVLMGKHPEQLGEATYQGRSVPLGKPMRGDVKKFKVFVKDPSTGNVKKVNFGDPNMRIKKSNPARRRSFRARHNCANPGPRTKARYWSCRKW